MFDHYEWFKNEVYRLTQIDLNYYKEKQMRRRIDTLAKKNGADSVSGLAYFCSYAQV